MSVFTDCLVAKTSTHSEALECISGNGVPACMRRSQGWKRLEESEAATSWCLFPSSSVPPRRPLLSWAHQCRVCGVVVDHVQGRMEGEGGQDAGCRGAEWGWGCGGKGHWRRSSVSDRENAITTSSAPENQQQKVREVLQTKKLYLKWRQRFSPNMLVIDNFVDQQSVVGVGNDGFECCSWCIIDAKPWFIKIKQRSRKCLMCVFLSTDWRFLISVCERRSNRDIMQNSITRWHLFWLTHSLCVVN